MGWGFCVANKRRASSPAKQCSRWIRQGMEHEDRLLGFPFSCSPSFRPSLRAEDRFPPPEFRNRATSQYQVPLVLGRLELMSTSPLWPSLCAAVYLVYVARSRRGVFIRRWPARPTSASIARGAVCPIGAIQNVTVGAFNRGYALPWVVALSFPCLLRFHGLVLLAFAGELSRMPSSGSPSNCPTGLTPRWQFLPTPISDRP